MYARTLSFLFICLYFFILQFSFMSDLFMQTGEKNFLSRFFSFLVFILSLYEIFFMPLVSDCTSISTELSFFLSFLKKV